MDKLKLMKFETTRNYIAKKYPYISFPALKLAMKAREIPHRRSSRKRAAAYVVRIIDLENYINKLTVK